VHVEKKKVLRRADDTCSLKEERRRSLSYKWKGETGVKKGRKKDQRVYEANGGERASESRRERG